MTFLQKGWTDGLMKDYFLDAWNLCDILGIIFFL